MMRTIDPAAKWDETPRAFRWSEVSRIDVGGAYEDALDRVARSRSAR
jgi:hypothetical protein